LKSLKKLAGALKKSQKGKSAGRRQMMTNAKMGLKAAGGRFLEGYKRGGGPLGRYIGNGEQNRGLENTLSMIGGGGNTSMPNMDSPERVDSPNSATVSYLSKQIRQLATVAASIGAITRDQQEALAAQLKEANRQSKEALAESGGQLVQNEAVNSIEPGQDVIADFYKSISELNNLIEDKVRDQQDNSRGGRFLDAFTRKTGLGGIRAESKERNKQARVKRGMEFDDRRGAYVNKKTGRTVKEADALKNFKKVDPSNLRTQTGKLAQAQAVAKPGLMSRGLSSITSKLSGIMGAGTKTAGKRLGGALATGGKLGKDAISKIAGPLIKSALGKTALKSIPIVGALAGGAFAIGKLMQGDVVGAGLEAASGLAGPLTAIPALVASLSRDVYSNAFGVQPETDPMFGPRMGLVSSVVGTLVKQWVGSKIKSTNDTNKSPQQKGEPPALKTKTPPAPGGGKAQKIKSPEITQSAPTGGGMSAKKTPPPAMKTDGASPSGQPVKTATGPNVVKSGGPASSTAKMPISNSSKAGNLASATTAGGMQVPSPSATAGSDIMSASTDTPPPPVNIQGASTPSVAGPSISPTTRSGAKGTGDVPDPGYSDISSFAKQLYFGSNVMDAG